jgi:hypothetical protein
MSRTSLFTVVGLAAIAGSIAIAQPTKDKPATPAAKPATQPAGQPEMKLPPGWTAEDMQACTAAATPGPMHQVLAQAVGVWSGPSKMWMAPGTEPVASTCSTTITSTMDGRYIKCETSGDMPGMGPFSGFGIYGFDNVTQKFQAAWIDNCGTGISNGTGELSSDGGTLTWTYHYTCPITKKLTTMREIQHTTGKDSKTIEMFGTDPHSGKEFKMMEIALTRKPAAPASAPGSTR